MSVTLSIDLFHKNTYPNWCPIQSFNLDHCSYLYEDLSELEKCALEVSEKDFIPEQLKKYENPYSKSPIHYKYIPLGDWLNICYKHYWTIKNEGDWLVDASLKFLEAIKTNGFNGYYIILKWG